MMKPLDAVPIFLAELIGTGMLLCMGCGGVLNWGSPASHLQIVLNFGLVIMIIIQVFGAVSGAHLNPAITLAALIFKKISAPMALVYMTAQFLGSFMGFGLLKALTPPDVFGPPDAAVGHCMLVVHPDVSIMQALIIEFMATSVLVLILCSLFDPRNSHAHDSVSLRFGLAICALAFSFGGFTGCSMNPVRTFAPALWHGDMSNQWIYFLAPMAAAVFASLLYKTVFLAPKPAPKEPENVSLKRIVKESEIDV